MSRTRTCLIFNPAAGQTNPEQDLATIRALLEPSIDFDIRFTTEEVDADTIATDAIAEGASSIIASGGDGTLSAAACALVGTNIPLGVISLGYLRARRVIVRTNPPQEVVIDGEIMGTTPIDVECVPGGLTIFVPPDAAPPAAMEKLGGLPDLKVESKSAEGFD